ncbi:SET domain-containing protein [Hesseltinella vesiculosa]|uniref:SET domain-containing protein n=1 Tax=Hesseltinella vesiculosa TaxID=101127 RepID=A0A1X2GP93_9FUNG|nr:SET domain-containing protein [Hesseltinella vesiculosa]
MVHLEDFFKELSVDVDIQGQKLVAKRPIPAGTLLMEQAPLTQVPLPSIRRQRCNYCLRRASLQCCGRCRSAYFCSNTCFRNAWLHYHHVLCEPLEYDTYTNVDADRWLLERAALTLHSHARLNKHNSHSPPHLKYAIQALESYPQQFNSENEDDQADAPVQVLHGVPPPDHATHTPGATTTCVPTVAIDFQDVSDMLAPFDCPFTAKELKQVQQQITLSRFDIWDPEQHLDKVGYGVYPITTLCVAHSCLPNAAVTYRQDKQRIVALQDIAPGDIISISYVDLTRPKQERMEDLRRRFGHDYVCSCDRCQGSLAGLDALLTLPSATALRYDQAATILDDDINSWNMLATVKQLQTDQQFTGAIPKDTRMHPSEFSHYISRCINPEIYAKDQESIESFHSIQPFSAFARFAQPDMQLLTPLFERLAQLASVPAFSVSMILAAEAALRKYMDKQLWAEASRCATYLFVVYRLVYPALHPVCSFHATVLAKTCWNFLVQMELAGIGSKTEKIYLHGIKTWIDVARESAMNTFGQESSLYRDMVDLQWVFERDQRLR